MREQRASGIQFSREKENMGEPNNALKVYMNRPDRIRSVLEYYLGERLPPDWTCKETGEEEADMCEALESIKRDAEKRGMKQGVKQGEKRGRRQGERQGALGMLFLLVNDGVLKLEEAARRASLSEAAFCREMKKAGYRQPS